MGLQYNDDPGPDIHIRRKGGVVTVNVPYIASALWDYPGRFAMGNTSDGTYDLALNILQVFRPGREVAMRRPGPDGKMCDQGTFSRAAIMLHRAFAQDFLILCFDDALDIPAARVKEWIKDELGIMPEFRRSFVFADIDGYLDATMVQDDGVAHRFVQLCDKKNGLPATFGDGRLTMVLHSNEEDAPGVHHLFNTMLGMRLKVSITAVVDE
jgi:hypothetical protein